MDILLNRTVRPDILSGYYPGMTLRIREIREAQGKTLKDIGEAIGASEVSVSRYERQESRVNVTILRRLAAALDCSIADLLGETEIASSIEANRNKLRAIVREALYLSLGSGPDSENPTYSDEDIVDIIDFLYFNAPGKDEADPEDYARAVKSNILPIANFIKYRQTGD